MFSRSLIVLALATAVCGETLAPMYTTPEPIPNRYFLKVKNKYVLGELVDDLLAENERHAHTDSGFGHIDILDEMDGAYLKILYVDLDYKSLDTVRRHPAVEFVEEEDRRPITSDDDHADFDESDWLGIDTARKREHPKRFTEEDFELNKGAFYGLDRINQREAELDQNLTFSGNGFGVNIYLISTGVLQTHDDFDCRVRMAYDVMSKTGDDCSGSGTNAAGIAVGKTVGVAKAAMVHSVRVHDCNGTETTTKHVSAIQWVTNNLARPCVALLTVSVDRASKTLQAAAEALADAGCVVVVKAAPTYGAKRACSYSPGRSHRLVAVGATYPGDGKTSWSGDGICVDIFAPGHNLMTTSPINDGYYDKISGPNLAAAFVAGVAAIHLGNKVDAADVKHRILSDSTPCVVGNELLGAPNRLLYVAPGQS